MSNKIIKIDQVLASAIELPLVKIDRDSYLRRELAGYAHQDVIEVAIVEGISAADIPDDIIELIAGKAILLETKKVTALSAIAGIPGGLAMVATVPTDMSQFVGHQLRIMQKLMYLYGWDDMFKDGQMDDETKNLIIVMFGTMFGVKAANKIIFKAAEGFSCVVAKQIASKALTKTFYYPIIKKIASAVGAKMTKDIFAKGVSKLIPVAGAAASGGLTLVTFYPMCKKLERHLQMFNQKTQCFAPR